MNILKKISQTLLGLALIYAGIGHLTFSRIEFRAQVPTWLPLDADFVVLFSGVIEITLGLALVILWKYKMFVGLVTALFFQPLLVAAALLSTDAWKLLKLRKRS